jgi:hypothetical protein
MFTKATVSLGLKPAYRSNAPKTPKTPKTRRGLANSNSK